MLLSLIFISSLFAESLNDELAFLEESSKSVQMNLPTKNLDQDEISLRQMAPKRERVLRKRGRDQGEEYEMDLPLDIETSEVLKVSKPKNPNAKPLFEF